MLKPKTSLIGKLEDSHQITTTWILNPQLTKVQTDSLIGDLIKSGFLVKNDMPNHLKVCGTSSIFSKIFNININKFKDHNDDMIFHVPNSELVIPKVWENKVSHILGLNTSKVAHHYSKILNNSKDITAHATTTFTPPQLATLYNFPTGFDGTGQKIGIIELGGGFLMSDLTTYFSQLGITGNPNVTAVSVDGGINNPNDPSGANIEVLLDIEIIMAIVPKATILVYFAPNSDKGFYDAINKAITDGCGIISISWGAAESFWLSSSMTSFNNLFQTAVTPVPGFICKNSFKNIY